MRTRSLARLAAGRLAVLALVAVAAAVSVVPGEGRRTSQAPPRAGATAWEGFVGDARPEVALGQRVIVVLNVPSLAQRVAENGGKASDVQQRRWTAAAAAAQKLFVSSMRVQGAAIQPEFSYTRTLNAFSAALDPRAIALLDRATEVEGIYPVRAAYPAAVSSRVLARETFAPGMGRRPDVALPGFDGRGVRIAILDTGVDHAHPYLRGRVEDGIDVVDDGEHAGAAPRPDNGAELERHGTQLAGIIVGALGPAALSGVATGAKILPVRVAGWQQDAAGAWAVYSRTDQILAGLERAVDPNGDGATHDAARVALVGVVERYAAFASGPLARAAAGALRLDTLVVTPAGNDGPAGPGFGSIAGPGGAPAALTVGAADMRRRHDEVRVVLRTGLNVVYDRAVPLAGAVAPERPLTLSAGAPAEATDEQAEDTGPALADFFDADGFSLVAGRAAIVRAGTDPAAVVRAAARAGASAVVVFGAPLPAGALGLDERVPVPVVGVAESAALELLTALAAGASTGVSISAPSAVPNHASRLVARFSSHGLAFDGRVKPELTGPGVGIATSEPGVNNDGSPRFGTVNGSSAAAAAAAGAVALLAHARPGLDGATLKSLLVGSARSLGDAPVSAQGAGFVDVGAAAATEVAARPATLAFGRATTPGWKRARMVEVRNLSTRPLRLLVGVETTGFPAAETTVTATPKRLDLKPGARARIRVEASVPTPTDGGAAAEGAVVLTPRAGRVVRVPYAIAFGGGTSELLTDMELSETSFEASDTAPSVLSLRAGEVRTIGEVDEVHPLSSLEIELRTGSGKRIGTLARQRNLLPGWYAFAVTGRDPGGQRLKPGAYRLRVVAAPIEGPPTEKLLEFSIE